MKQFESILLSVGLLAALFSCTKNENEQLDADQPSNIELQEDDSPEFVEGEMNILFDEEIIAQIEEQLSEGQLVTKSSALNGIVSSLGITSMERIFPYAGKFEERTRKEGLHRWYKVHYQETVTKAEAEKSFRNVPGIVVAEPVRQVKRTAVFDDPQLSSQWHYINDGTLSDHHKKGCDINVKRVWENYTTGSRDVIVAVVDGGVDAGHEDLKDSYVGGYNFVNNTSIVDADSHGTHVAGTIAARNNNGIGVAGVAGGNAKKGVDGVGILSCQIFAQDPDDPDKSISGGTSSAIKWGADNGAVISQNSWGLVYKSEWDALRGSIPGDVKAAVDYFIKYAGIDENGRQTGPMKGGVVIFAAGNEGFKMGHPASYESIIAVGAVQADYTRASYTNYGDWVDICAPGGNTGKTKGGVLSCLPGNKYGALQGTSMACPHVSGVAALIVSHFGGPGFTNEMLKERLLNGANSKAVSANNQIGPLVDAFGAFAIGGTIAPDPVKSYTAEPVSNSIDFEFAVTADKDDAVAYGYTLAASKDKSLLESFTGQDLSGVSACSVSVEDYAVGDIVKLRLPDLEFETDYFVTVVAYDYNRNFSTIAPIKSVRTLKNNPPVVSTSQEGSIQVKSHLTVRTDYVISDPDGHKFTVKFTSGSAADGWSDLGKGQYQLSIVGNAVEPGDYAAKLTVTDQYGAITEETLAYTILPNTPPALLKGMENLFFSELDERFTMNMDEYLYDPDGEILRYEVSISDRSVLHLNPQDNVLYATVLGYGSADVIIKAYDSRTSTEFRFKVLVKEKDNIMELYPNPVVDNLYVRTGDVLEASVQVYSSTGALVMETSGLSSAFDPLKVDMSGCAPGRYTVKIIYEGVEYTRAVVKL